MLAAKLLGLRSRLPRWTRGVHGLGRAGPAEVSSPARPMHEATPFAPPQSLMMIALVGVIATMLREIEVMQVTVLV